MLRVVFTRDDVMRVRVADHIDPMWEIVLSLHQLVARHPHDGPYRTWAAWIRTMVRDRVAPAAAALYELVPPKRYFPDFVTPVPPSTSLDHGIDAVLHAPLTRLRDEMDRAKAPTSESSWLAGIAAGETRQLHRLADVLRAYHTHALAPFYDQITSQVAAHRHSIIQRLAGGGVHELLGNLAGCIRWEPPVLTAPYPGDLTVDLAGRGVTLIPSFFCQGAPVTVANVELDPILVYPIDPPRQWMQPPDGESGTDRHLTALIGTPRAALLRALTAPLDTTQLAARAGLALSSASEHTAILRNCDLVTSTRKGRAVVHSLTPLGRQLLAGGHTWMSSIKNPTPETTTQRLSTHR